jgi:multicomponent Na+:H+ antiporter subunit C
MPYAICFLLFMVGLYCAVVKKNMVKIVIGLMVMEYAVNLFLIMLGYRFNGIAPILSRSDVDSETGKIMQSFLNASVDPLPQALVLTSIVISLGSLALLISICVRIYQKYGTFDITEIRRLKG